MSASIAVLATLDTKAAEARFLGDYIEKLGNTAIYIDLGLRGESPSWCDIRPYDPATRSASADLSASQKSSAMRDLSTRAAFQLLDLIHSDKLHGLVGLGGGQGTWLVAEVAKLMPLGFPKLLVTTLATRAGTYLGNADVTVMPSITDIAGLNPILRRVLTRAAGAIIGSVAHNPPPDVDAPALTAMTMFGVTTKGGTHLKSRLEQAEVEVAVFHANGNGGSVMEQLIRDGQVTGVIDWTTTELADEMVGGIATAGTDRLTAAGEAGLPQVVVPGALDVVNFGPLASVPDRYRDRLLHQHTPSATLMRTSVREMRMLAAAMAVKINLARGPVAVVVPEYGFSSLGAPGAEFHDPTADAAWLDTLRSELNSAIDVVTYPLNINDTKFGDHVAGEYLKLVPAVQT